MSAHKAGTVSAAASALFLLGCSASSPLTPEDRAGRETARVVRVVDGDTIRARRHNATEEPIRLIGIDTPELGHGGTTTECFALEASRFASRRLLGHEVSLEIGEEAVDRYGRTLAYVFVEDELFNETLVARGFARQRSYPPNLAYQERLRRAERRARAERLGLWSACGLVPAG